MRRILAVLLTIGLPIVVVAGMVALVVLRPEKPRERSPEGLPSQLSPDQSDVKRQAGIETEPIAYRELYKEVRLAGKLDYNETRLAEVTTLIAGQVDFLSVDSSGVRVRKGDRLAEISSQEVLLAQNELIRALSACEKARAGQAERDQELALADLERARKELLLLGVLPDQIAEIEKARKPSTHLPIHAPIDGTVVEKNVRAGQNVKVGDTLYRIADLDPIWLYLDVPEFDLGWVQYGQPVDVTIEAFPDETFRGIVAFIEPFLDDKTRTVRARVNMCNADGKLKPSMLASATAKVRLRSDGTPGLTGMEGRYICIIHPEIVQDAPGRCTICKRELHRVPGIRPDPGPGQKGGDMRAGKVLAIPTAAVLQAGWRKVTYRQTAGGGYELVELTVGPRAEGKDQSGQTASYFPVLAGLQEGDRVVVRGGFLLDSQRQIEGLPSLLYPQGRSLTASPTRED